ncbi:MULTISPECIES: cell envelope integrity protein TolA [Legionella]|uniref:Cell envelope integrity protein TolA n=1 Tax=Legionella septentrionalis TaxID=2498109 RepID=A0A3S0X521_9GAMM|nr:MULTISPECIES: cell envelope integrity protein TolA [Legionella]MCP0914480.1 cell envelope integrity protein TolA [Legionella sp. 27cVA30]RUQ89458.1 cell envelope integrity protein TolA [Legionella septentrionalis]RUQ97299.1 cell envelope integrity protein TolA [Legionella septentrionalis]RUR10471.1 cell envelope integrity protein TolA [Legionella septentrionalis]RUR16091.1 cell envelope integrity protein TolA [Legionella septentrionalis]
MMNFESYKSAFIGAILLHLLIVVLLLAEPSNTQPTLELSAKNEVALPQTAVQESKPEEQAIKAVSVDQQEVTKAVNQLKAERLREKQAEENRQRALAQQAEAARKRRIEEQQRLERLKNEAAKLALAREKQLAEEQKRLKQLAKQKEEEEKRLAEMKKKQLQLEKQQKEEAAKLAELQKQKAAEAARMKKEQEEKARAEAEQKRLAAQQQAAMEAERNARIAGEVDKYKALIINAISRQWILPENVDSSLSSQFRIRLAPNGAVLEVSLTRSSGDPVLDRSAQSAIYKASPLPVPSDPDTFNVFREISLTVRPENVRG